MSEQDQVAWDKTMGRIVTTALNAIFALESISDEHRDDLSMRIMRYVACFVLGRQPSADEWHAISCAVTDRRKILLSQPADLTPTLLDVLDLSCGCVVRTQLHKERSSTS